MVLGPFEGLRVLGFRLRIQTCRYSGLKFRWDEADRQRAKPTKEYLTARPESEVR